MYYTIKPLRSRAVEKLSGRDPKFLFNAVTESGNVVKYMVARTRKGKA